MLGLLIAPAATVYLLCDHFPAMLWGGGLIGMFGSRRRPGALLSREQSAVRRGHRPRARRDLLPRLAFQSALRRAPPSAQTTAFPRGKARALVPRATADDSPDNATKTESTIVPSRFDSPAFSFRSGDHRSTACPPAVRCTARNDSARRISTFGKPLESDRRRHRARRRQRRGHRARGAFTARRGSSSGGESSARLARSPFASCSSGSSRACCKFPSFSSSARCS